MSIFHGLGRALRWLRDRQGKRQYQVADSAGITKAMLSAYETGKQKPSLETLEKILSALDCDLNDLHNALQIVNERPEAIRRPGALPQGGGMWPPFRTGLPEPEGFDSGPDVYRVLGLSRALPPSAEQALSEMLDGSPKSLRYLHGRPVVSPPVPPVPPPPVADESEPFDEAP